MPRRFHISAFGCQMNVLDAEVVAGELRRAGYEAAPDEASADVVLFHTCSVRDQSENKVWSRVGALRHRRAAEPALRIGVLGCMAQREGRKIFRRAPHVDVVCGTRMFPRIVEWLRRADAGERVLAVETVECLPPPRHLSSRPEPHKAFVTAMRGCDHACTFCIVPTVRGAQVSVPFAGIVAEVEALVADGVREVMLLGQNIDAYGRDLPGTPTLADLLRRLDRIPGLWRLRFITSHPGDITLDLLDAMAEGRTTCPMLAMPAQSGSDPVLRRMARKYTVARYREIVAAARARLPRLDLATDWIVGFPGETDADFALTLGLLRDVEPQTSYVFKYSPRPGTPSATHFADDIPDAVKRARHQALLAEHGAISERHNRAWIGRTIEVLVDGPSIHMPMRLAGRTPEHRLAVFEGPPEWTGTRVALRVVRASASTLYAEPVDAAVAAGVGA